MSVPRQSAVWDKRRNSSRVFPVDPRALPAALDALADLRRREPALVAWIEAGHPLLTHERHVELFGEPYRGVRSRAK